MTNDAAISVNLPEELVSRVRKVVDRQRESLDEVISVALEREMERRERFAAMIRENNEWGRQAGFRSEQDVERIANGELPLNALKRTA